MNISAKTLAKILVTVPAVVAAGNVAFKVNRALAPIATARNTKESKKQLKTLNKQTAISNNELRNIARLISESNKPKVKPKPAFVMETIPLT